MDLPDYSDALPVFTTYEVLVVEDDRVPTGLLDCNGRPIYHPSKKIKPGYI